MYSLMIVDDEPLAQVGLRSMLDWASIGVELAGTCPNGERAYEEILRAGPDIVITDVRMPLLDGLGLIERCRATMEAPPAFIVLSGYADFESARRSLRSRAVDFLAKLELDEAALLSSVERAKAAVEEARAARSGPALPAAGKGGRGALLDFLSRYFADEAEAARAFAECGLGAPPAGACLAARVEASFPFAERLDEGERERAFRCARDMMVEIAKRGARVLEGDAGEFAFALLLFGAESAAEAREKRRATLQDAAEMVRKYFGVSLAVSLGSVSEGLAGSAASYRAAVSASGGSREGPASTSAGPPERAGGTNPLAEGVRAYVLKNYSAKLALAEVAAAFRVSPNHLSTVFKRHSGIGFNEFVAKVKVEKAKELLLEGRRRSFEVAQALGFEDAFYFSKVFKRVTGFSPREFCLRRAAMQAAEREDGPGGEGPRP